MKRLTYYLFVLLFFSACRKADVKEKYVSMNLAAPPVVEDIAVEKQSANALYLKEPKDPIKAASEVSKKIIKEGTISFEVKDIKQTRNAIYNSITKLGGYVSLEMETTSNEYNRKQYILNLRVPAKKFDQLLNGVASVAEKIDSKNIRIKDVTTEYIDISAQLDNKKKLEERYQELLKRAGKMADMLEIENKLTEIRTDIESTQGRLNYLVSQVNYSSLDITFYTRQLIQDNENTFGYRLSSALSGGWVISGTLFFGFLQVWPIWILLGIAIYITQKWRRKQSIRKGDNG